jgi:hypothetical protein
MKRCLSTSNVNDANNEPFVTALSKKARKQKKVLISATQPSTSASNTHDQSSSTINIDEIINSVVNARDDHPLDNNNSTQCDNCSCVCNELKCQLDKQQSIINKLVCHLNFVLSFLNIAENVDTGTFNSDHKKPKLIMASASASSSSNPVVPPNVVSNGVSPGAPATWSQIVTNGPSNQPTKPAKFNDAVMSAVYADKHEKERRSKSFIVSGLRARTGITDKEAVCQLCTDEFGIAPSVLFCKRLGEERTNATQPLLVAVHSAEQAEEIISCARSLRRSTDHTVKDNIYINQNLTKAEAHAAYLERCRRRLQATKRLHGNRTMDDNSAMDINSPTAAALSDTSYGTRVFTNSQRHESTDQNSTNGRQDRASN